jgi:hypothetical protein
MRPAPARPRLAAGRDVAAFHRRQTVGGGPQLVLGHGAGVDELLPVQALLVGVAGLALLDPQQEAFPFPLSRPVTGELQLVRRVVAHPFIRTTRKIVAPAMRLRGRSQSRIGLTDLGQNRRNLRRPVRFLRAGAD